VTLVLYFGVDYRYVDAPYIGPTWHYAMLDIPFRILVPCLVSLLMIAVLEVILTRISSAAPSWRWRRISWRSS